MILCWIYLIGMICSLGMFIILNQKYQWVTREFYKYDYDCSRLTATLLLAMIYPLPLFVILCILVQKYLKSRRTPQAEHSQFL